MRILETDNWSLLLPPEWEAERDEDAVLISDRDGVGCLEISLLLTDGEQPRADDIRAFSGAPEALRSARMAGQEAWTAEYEEEGAALREWWVLGKRALLYITYSCDLENQGMDDPAVDDILSTLRIAVEE